MITMQLDPQMWVAYSTEHGVLRRAWREGVDFIGTVYNQVHGPQPSSIGPAYLADSAIIPWRIITEDGEVVPDLVYGGHRIDGGRVTLMMSLVDPGGAVLRIEETPAYVTSANGEAGLQRTFQTSGIPEGSKLFLEMSLSSMASPMNFKTNGVFQPIRVNEDHVFGRLALNSNEITTFVSYFGDPSVERAEAAAAPVDEGFRLISRNDCTACHDINAKTVGPAYRAIADRYRADKSIAPQLVEKVIKGAYGNWGEAAMNPHPTLDHGDVQKMVEWILKLESSTQSKKASSSPLKRSRIQKLKDTLHIWKSNFEHWRLRKQGRPGDTLHLEDVHPSFSVQTIRPRSFQPRVAGLDVFEDGRIALSTWDSRGSVYLLSKSDVGTEMDVKEIASGLAEPLGLKIVDGIIYVMQKQEITRLVDVDGDDVIDRYETVANDWGATSNFHEFGFGLAYQDDKFFVTLATAIAPGGVSLKDQNQDRGSILRVDPKSGQVDIIAHGLRVPNGIGVGLDDELFVTDNEGSWLPANKMVHVKEGAFYGSRAVDFPGTDHLPVQNPVVFLPRDEIANSPSEPAALNVGPYHNQMICGDSTHGGLKRIFIEKINGDYQGAVFRFSQGFEAGVNRIVWDSDGSLIVGGVGGGGGNWFQPGKLTFGLQRMVYSGAPVFEMLAVRAQQDGFEIEFTEPLAEESGESASDYFVQHWTYLPTKDYGGDKIHLQKLTVDSVEISADRTKARLKINDLMPNRVVYIRLKDSSFRSEPGRSLWTTEVWYTLNAIPR